MKARAQGTPGGPIESSGSGRGHLCTRCQSVCSSDGLTGQSGAEPRICGKKKKKKLTARTDEVSKRHFGITLIPLLCFLMHFLIHSLALP